MKKRSVLCAVAIALLSILLTGCGIRVKSTGSSAEAPNTIGTAASPVPDSETQQPRLDSVKTLFPEADAARVPDGFVPDGSPYSGGRFGSSFIDDAFIVLDADGSEIGAVVIVRNRDAYNPPLVLAVGIETGGTVRGIVFIELNETPGKGTVADEPAFKDQFCGRTADAFVLNGDGEDGIDAISGATSTSKAVLNAVNAALDFSRGAIR